MVHDGDGLYFGLSLEMELRFCVSDPTWNQKSVDRSVPGYGEVEPDSDSDADDDDGGITQWRMSSPRGGFRQAESLEGPYSLLSLPLPSDAPDSSRQGSDRDSPGRSSAAVASRSSRSLDQRLDELFAEGRLGDGMSPPSSVSDRQSDVESDSLSEEELDIIKLRKPVTVTLQPGTSKPSHSLTPHSKSSDPKSSEQKSDVPKADPVTPAADEDASLSDDMVDQIVRVKPILAKVARQPSQVAAANNSPEDLSLKSCDNLPVDLSSKPYSSEKVVPVCSNTTSTSVSISSDVSTTASLPASSARSNTRHPSAEARYGPLTVTEAQALLSSSNVRIMTDAGDDRTKTTTSTLVAPSAILPMPSISSVQQFACPSGTESSVITRSADGVFGCQKRASDQHFGQPVSDNVLNTSSRYSWNSVVVCYCYMLHPSFVT